ncbi:MAG: InlB B-repeat-containing protein [Clostridia bacterium]|nr:InlB B-repeat-containing protein [Clostridia bacterium]
MNNQKFLSLILLLALLLPCFTMMAVAVERDENIDVSQDHNVDQVVMYEQDAGQPFSSGGRDRWNKILKGNGTKTGAVDPLNSENNVLAHTSEVDKESRFTKYIYMDPVAVSDTVVFSIDLLIPTPSDETIFTEQTRITLLGNAAITLTYNSEEDLYEGTYFSQSFKVKANTWMRFYNVLSPSEVETEHVLVSQLSGLMQNDEGEEVRVLQEKATITRKTTEVLWYVKGQAGKQGLVYADNTTILKPGDFAFAKVTTEMLGDLYKNFDLEGKISLRLYHTIDMSTLDVSRIRVSNQFAEELPYTSVSLSYDAQTVTFDFAGNKLPKHETVYFCFGEGVEDLLGQEMLEPTVELETRGDKDEYPLPPDRVIIPQEGFVMPDRWNTGYRCDESELVPLAEKYPDLAANSYVISEDVARKYNFEFSHFSHTGRIYVTATSPIYIHDFYIENGGIYNGKTGTVKTSSSRVTIAWGEGNGTVSDNFCSGPNLTVSHCYVHDVKADHMKADSGQIIEFNYFRDGGTRSPGAHADVIQFMGGSTYATMDVKVYGNRFDIPNLAYDHVANACFFYSPESHCNGCVNVQAVGNWFNGGGYTTYLAPEEGSGPSWQIYFENNQFGYGHSHGSFMAYNGKWVPANGGSYENNDYVGNLLTGSVVYFSGEGEEATRVFSSGDLTDGKGRILVNFANYMLMARGYRIEVEVLDDAGNVVQTVVKEGEIRRYISPKEYLVSSNLKDTGYTNDTGKPVYQLIELPDLPHDVYEYVELPTLPTSMQDHRIVVKVYDTAGAEDMLIRTSELGEKISDIVTDDKDVFRPGEVEVTYYTVVFKDADGNELSTQTIKEGQSAVAPTAPLKEGYTFAGWSLDFSSVQSDLVVIAQYTKDNTSEPPAKSEELLAFEALVAAAEAAQNGSLSERLASIYAADLAWWKIEDIEEEGARDAYVRFIEVVAKYNQDIAKINDHLSGGEKTSDHLLGMEPQLNGEVSNFPTSPDYTEN